MVLSARSVVYMLFVLCPISLLVAAGCKQNIPPAAVSGFGLPGSQSSASSALGQETDGYAGDAACTGCHYAIAQKHHSSNHALTLHIMEPANLGKIAPPAGHLPGLPFTLKIIKNSYYIDTYPPSGALQELQFAFGTGKHGVTYVAVMPGNQLLEMRESYFPRQRRWHSTPGQEKFPLDYAGRIYEPNFSRQCFGCHVVTLPPNTLTPERRFMGVGCEACHGPARAHVAAMEAGSSGTTLKDLHIERIGTWGAQRTNDMCGKCHGTAASVGSSNPNLLLTPRFQPYALMLSRCFRESRNVLSCVTCHDAHQNTSHDTKAYEAACLNCHADSSRKDQEKKNLASNSLADMPHPKSITASSQGRTCPVNPHFGCIGCHMPAGKVMPGSMVGSVAPDHYIRVYRPEKEAAETRLQAPVASMRK